MATWRVMIDGTSETMLPRQLRSFVIICSLSALLYTTKTIGLGGGGVLFLSVCDTQLLYPLHPSG